MVEDKKQSEIMSLNKTLEQMTEALELIGDELYEIKKLLYMQTMHNEYVDVDVEPDMEDEDEPN